MPPSTRNLAALPGISTLRRLTRSLAMLDAILEPEWQYRYYSFDSGWDDDELLASMRNGQGDDWKCVFNKAGVILSGLAHEAPMFRAGDPWPGIFDGVPSAFADFLDEPAFDHKNTTFCIWRLRGAHVWSHGPVEFAAGEDPDGSARLLALLDGNPATYASWATEYYERNVDGDAVAAIYGQQPLTTPLVTRLNPEIALEELREDAEQIGYPETGPT